MRPQICFSTFLFLSGCLLSGVSSRFDPTTYTRTTAACKAVKRDADHAIVDIELSYVDINPSAKTAIILVHGWPSIWSTWAYQIQALEKDYHLIVPDLRGFGRSSHPEDVQTSGTMFDHVGDLTCILEHAKVDTAICLGHDWGSVLCYEAGRLRPDLFQGVVGAVVPYIPSAGPFVPIKDLTGLFPKLTYQLFFGLQTPDAVKELDRDIRRSLRATLRAKSSPPPDEFLKSSETFLGAWSDYEEIPPIPFLSPEEEDYLVQEFSHQGFKNTLQFYTPGNRHGTWKFASEQGNHTLPQPVLAIYPTHDPVADWVKAAEVLKSESFLPRQTTATVEGSHWIHMENPEPFNAALKSWLEANFGGLARAEDEL
ncbi:Alpha/Beta hydrolase protein [Armillaria novae-zelandiae]|uniref:Alpha/Beta hydrolase protein n=1 Tax=Armillaria novae-zelandiae TaxID=153914 RepID=A0AA39PUL3_9AGAR|nr:Alpha/Beta hydrolase protein [Armillaria novae-zelandiae]